MPAPKEHRVSRSEFERRYHSMPNLKKAELIEGVVYVPSPVRVTSHGQPHAMIITWLGIYAATTPNLMLADNATVRLDFDNEVQPDALLRFHEDSGGRSRISEDDYVEGSPELIVEIASSSASYELHDKKDVYRRNGVQEYLVWLVQEQAFRWYVLEEQEFQLQEPDTSIILKSPFLTGLWLDVEALLSKDLEQLIAIVQAGINSPEYKQFVGQLNRY